MRTQWEVDNDFKYQKCRNFQPRIIEKKKSHYTHSYLLLYFSGDLYGTRGTRGSIEFSRNLHRPIFVNKIIRNTAVWVFIVKQVYQHHFWNYLKYQYEYIKTKKINKQIIIYNRKRLTRYVVYFFFFLCKVYNNLSHRVYDGIFFLKL